MVQIQQAKISYHAIERYLGCPEEEDFIQKIKRHGE